MRSLFISFLFLQFFCACTNNNQQTSSDDDIGTARNFIDAALQGDYDKARKFMIQEAVAMAVRALKNKAVKKIILTRPAVEAGENLGFLPGDLKEKIDPYLRPLYDALDDMIPADKLGYYMTTRTIEIAPLAYMRGRTLDNAYIILDEAQNATDVQLKMFLTRIGANAKAIITGDLTQVDLPRNQRSGLEKASRILRNIDGIGYIELDEEDVVRHRLVKSILKAYTAEGLKEMEQDEAQRAERKQRGYYDRDRHRD
jgi:phosphate starvation-inducible PhoH-like protein